MRASWRRLILVMGVTACGSDGPTSDPGVTAPVATVAISPGTLLLQVGESFVLTATLRDASGASLTGRAVAWTTSQAATLSVEPNGAVAAVAAGTATITATADGKTATINVVVMPKVQRVAVAPASPAVELGSSLQMTLVLLDGLDNQIHVTVPVTWTVSLSARASVSATGLLTPATLGAVSVTATFATGSFPALTSTTNVQIIPPVQIVAVEVLPNPMGLIVGQTRTLGAIGRDQNGVGISGRTYVWSVQQPLFASVAPATGVVTAIQPGTTEVLATTSSRTGGAFLTVFPAAPAAGIGVGFGLDQFSLIPAGTFRMGSTDGNTDERPVRDITMTSFRIQKTEVTQQQWLSIMSTLPAENSTCDLCPVTNVSFDQAQAFVAQLNTVIPGAGFRLPTEAQWEYAARANSLGLTYADLQLIAEYAATSDNHVWPVALRDPNAFLLYDVIGNVAEWTQDWYAPGYDPAQTVDPVGPASGTRHVDRGGAFSTTSAASRSSYRVGVSSAALVGLRLVRD